MKRWWPWETRRLGPHHFVVRPWRPHQDRRVHTGLAVLAGLAVEAAVWQVQTDAAATVPRTAATAITGLILVWGWRAWRR